MKAKQKTSFAQRAQMRASVVAPQSSMIPSRQTTVPKQQHATLNHRSIAGLRRRYSYGNPIGRKGVVVPIHVHNEHSDLSSTLTASQYALSSRRIRDPSAVRYHHSRTSPRVQYWMVEHGANASSRYEHPTPSVARSLQQQFDPGLPINLQQELDPYQQYSPQIDTEFHGCSVSSVRGTMDLSPMQWRHLEIPVGIPRFQKKRTEDTFFDPAEFEWNTTSMLEDHATLLESRGDFLRERCFPSIQRTDSSLGQSYHSVLINTPSQHSYNALQRHPPFSRSEISSLSYRRPSNNGDGTVSTQTPDMFGYSSAYPCAIFDQETSIQYDRDEEENRVGNRHNGGFMRFRRPLQADEFSASYFAPDGPVPPESGNEAYLLRNPPPTRPKHLAQPPLRFFNNGTEIDIHGKPLSGTWSSYRNDSRSIPVDEEEHHATVPTSHHELGGFFDEGVRGKRREST